MATVNKASLRSEFEALEARFESLCAADKMSAEGRVQVDLVFETRELTVEAEIKTCPRCRTENRGAFPNDMPGPLQYGHGIVAFAVHLLAAQMVSLKRTVQTLKALTGRAIAEATLPARGNSLYPNTSARRCNSPPDSAAGPDAHAIPPARNSCGRA